MTGGMIRGHRSLGRPHGGGRPGTHVRTGRWIGPAVLATLVGLAGPVSGLDDVRHGASAEAAARSGAILVDTATIVVSASATTSVTPDRARLRFAVETEAEAAADATAANADLTAGAIAAVRELLGTDDEVSTTGFSVSPIYSRDGDRRVVAYRTLNTLVVTLTDIELVGPTIDAAVGAGANRVDGLEFFAADSEDAYLDALARAVERGRAEAEVMAAAAGGELGRVVSIQSTRSGQPVARVMAEGMAMAATPIEPGDQTIGASIRLEIQLVSR